MDQLRSTVAVLGSHPEAQVPDSLPAMMAHTGGERAEALIAQVPPTHGSTARGMGRDAGPLSLRR
jgi:hypothetical protein